MPYAIVKQRFFAKIAIFSLINISLPLLLCHIWHSINKICLFLIIFKQHVNKKKTTTRAHFWTVSAEMVASWFAKLTQT